MSSAFQTVYSSLYPWEVQLLQQKLASEGIDSFIDGAGHVQANWMVANALGGVRLRVYTEDADLARGIILQQDEAAPPVGDVPLRCPACGSTQTRPAPWPMLALTASVLLLGIPFLFRNRLTCRACGVTWRQG